MTPARVVSAATFGAVVAGGMIGVALRAALVLPFGPGAHPLAVPAVTLAINLAGSLLLGVVVGLLDDHRPRLRVFLGTGVLGGFTTYSAFALEAVRLDLGLGILYAVLTTGLGIAAAAAGFTLARSRASEPVPEPGS